MKEKDLVYFDREKSLKNPIFFERFPGIGFQGLKVMDFGCGHGAISIDLAMKGAEEIVGIDLNADLIKFANENLNINYSELKDKITFKCMDLNELEDNYFDVIISKASFEHVLNLDLLLIKMKNKLKLGGKIITGFGPLYNSPWGDHSGFKHKVPWTHIIYGEKYFIKKINKHRKEKVETINDLGLNGYSLKKYMGIFNNTEGLSVVDLRTNVGNKISMRLFNLFSYFPFLREYFTYNIYCVLQRTQ